MKKPKLELEADLDPTGTRRTRPGGTAANRAVEATRTGLKPSDKGARSTATTTAATKTRPGGFAAIEADLDPPGTTRTRPGGTAAARAVAATRPGGKKR